MTRLDKHSHINNQLQKQLASPGLPDNLTSKLQNRMRKAHKEQPLPSKVITTNNEALLLKASCSSNKGPLSNHNNHTNSSKSPVIAVNQARSR